MPGLPMLRQNQTIFDVHYDEGLKVGYKWYDAENRTPLFPFGFGLSYTTFTMSDLKVVRGDGLDVSVRVRNTGRRAGQEVAQIYASLPAAAEEPPRRLVGWQKVRLEPGESRIVTIHVEPLYLSIFDVDKDRWTMAPGDYTISAGSSSRDLPLSAVVKLGEQ